MQSALVNFVQAKGAELIGDLLKDGDIDEGVAAGLHALVGCAGAAAQGGDCGAAAAGASGASLLGALLSLGEQDQDGDGILSEDERLSVEERNGRTRLLTAIITGLSAAGGVDGTSLTSLAAAAQIEAENNTTASGRRYGDCTPGVDGCLSWEAYKASEDYKTDLAAHGSEERVRECLKTNSSSCQTEKLNYQESLKTAALNQAQNGTASEGAWDDYITDWLSRTASTFSTDAAIAIDQLGEDYNSRLNSGLGSIGAGLDILGNDEVYQSGDGIAANLNSLEGIFSILGGATEYFASPAMGLIDTSFGRPANYYSDGAISQTSIGDAALTTGTLFTGSGVVNIGRAGAMRTGANNVVRAPNWPPTGGFGPTYKAANDPAFEKILTTYYGVTKAGSNRVGVGGLGDALRYEKATGELLSDTGHLQKAIDVRRRLKTYVRKAENQPPDKYPNTKRDIDFARELIKDLDDAIGS